MQVSAVYNRASNERYRGGFSEVWKGKCYGEEVAVKVIRTHSESDLERVVGVSLSLISPSACRDENAMHRNFAGRL
jgi:hypothetical protein